MKKELILEGAKDIIEILENIENLQFISVKSILWHKKAKENFSQDFEKLEKLANNKKIEFIEISNSEFKNLRKTIHSKGVFAVLEKIDNFKDEDIIEVLKNSKKVIILDQIQDPGNFGTIIRTASFFGIDCIITTKDSVSLDNPKVLRSLKGYFSDLKIIESKDLKDILKFLKLTNFEVFVADIGNDSKNIFEQKFDKFERIAFIFGSEGQGISKIEDKTLLADLKKIKIDVAENKYNKENSQSLNLAISVGIILFEVSKYGNKK